MGSDYSVTHAVELARMLPKGSRIHSAAHKDIILSREEDILVQIEYALQVILKAITSDKKLKPKQITFNNPYKEKSCEAATVPVLKSILARKREEV